MKNSTLFLRPVGGLGNRIRVVTSAIDFCRQNKSDLHVYWVIDQDCPCNFYLLFQKIEGIYMEVISGKSQFLRYYYPHQHPVGAVKFLKFQLFNLHKVLKGIGETVFFQDLQEHFDNYLIDNNVPEIDFENHIFQGTQKLLPKLNVNAYLSTCYPLTKNFDVKLLSFQPSILKIADDYLKNNQLNQFIGLHIRGTDHKLSKKYSKPNLFVEKINQIIVENKDSKFYLSTDDKESFKFIVTMIPRESLFFREKNWKRNSEEGTIDSLVDICILSKCQSILGSANSSFSKIASLYGNISLEIVK